MYTGMGVYRKNHTVHALCWQNVQLLVSNLMYVHEHQATVGYTTFRELGLIVGSNCYNADRYFYLFYIWGADTDRILGISHCTIGDVYEKSQSSILILEA
jgi:hypothetical protein